MLSSLPKYVWVLVPTYFAASLAYFTHNAEYIAFYPSMPGWLIREYVYLSWLAATCIGALGLDGLAHYTLALCSEHTFATDATIWSEAISGLLLLLVSAVLFSRSMRARAGIR